MQKDEGSPGLGDNQGLLHALRLAQLLGPDFNKKFLEALWSRDGRAVAILAQLTHADLAQKGIGVHY